MNGRSWLAVLSVIVCLAMLLEATSVEILAGSAESQEEQSDDAYGSDQPDQNDTEIAEELLNEIELTDVQDMLDELLGEDSFSMKDALVKLTKGEQAFSKEAVQEVVYRFFFYRLEQERGLFVKLLLLVLFAAVFSSFADVFENEQIGNISIIVV